MRMTRDESLLIIVAALLLLLSDLPHSHLFMYLLSIICISVFMHRSLSPPKAAGAGVVRCVYCGVSLMALLLSDVVLPQTNCAKCWNPPHSSSAAASHIHIDRSSVACCGTCNRVYFTR